VLSAALCWRPAPDTNTQPPAQTHNPGWRELVWDEAAVLELVCSHFPWFLPTYLAYAQRVQRSDVARYMVLHTHGGVYLDADVSGGVGPDTGGSAWRMPGGGGGSKPPATAAAPRHTR
jgi:hypothetical protein